MMIEYKSNDDKIISQWMMNEDNLKIVCQRLIGYKFYEEIIHTIKNYTIEKILEDELRYSIFKNMKGDIVRTDIDLISNNVINFANSRIQIVIFADDKIILNDRIVLDDLYTIVKSEMRDIKLNELGLW